MELRPPLSSEPLRRCVAGVVAAFGRALPPVAILALVTLSPLGAQERWALARAPEVVIGAAAGPDEALFHDIRGAFVARDGSIVVADGSTREVRVFAQSGALRHRFGGRGDGPREFRVIGWAESCGGEGVVVYDLMRHRVTHWTLGGELQREFLVEGPDEGVPPWTVRCGTGGDYAVVGWPDAGSFRGSGPYRMDVRVAMADSLGRRSRLVGSFPGPERYRYAASDGPRPLGRSTTVIPGRGGLYVGTGDHYEILVLGEGEERRRLVADRAPVRMTDALLRTWHDSVLATLPPERRAEARRGLQSHQHPEVLPAYRDFLVDRAGRVWVTPFGAPGQPVTELDLLEADGSWRATVAIPPGFRLTDVDLAGEFVLGVHTDGAGIETVRRYRIGPSRR